MTTLDEVIVKARNFIETQRPDEALEFLESYAKGNEQNSKFLSILGETYLEISDLDQAYDLLNKACRLDQNAEEGVEKFLYLGQMIGGKDGEELLTIGINRLTDQLETLSNDANTDSNIKELLKLHGDKYKVAKYLVTKLDQALFVLIEIWMTDLCMEPEAESKCEELITKAIRFDDEIAQSRPEDRNPEVWSTLANIRISQQRPDDARQAVSKAWELFNQKKSQLESISSDPDTNDKAVNEATIEYIELIQPLITLTRYSIELGLLELAISIASSIQDINEQNVDSFYLEGFAHSLLAKQQQFSIEDIGQLIENEELELNLKDPRTQQTIQDARVALSSAFKLLQVDSIAEETDEELVEKINQLLNQVGGFLLKEKDTTGIDETNWENEIEEDI
ncbi:BA75_01585T0 [Komagataella pastoris]|uniref:BA75_01585T0 n=1 Tax=Komagataella pastoris TaxID=4922 RepID=A0A1B2JA28_PICPA|nr:BA75_01585T0 [Komagataella pastoris]